MTPFQENVRRVKDHVRAMILRAELPEGSAVHEDMLRAETGASVRAVKTALRELAREGIIHRKRNAGTHVAERLPSVICAVLPPVRSMAVLSTYDEHFLRADRYTAAVLAGIREKLSAPATLTVIANPRGELKSLDDVPAIDTGEQKQKVQGLISLEANNVAVLNQYVSAGLPLVSVDFAVQDGLFDMVTVDHLQHGYVATRHLLELGHRRVAFIGEKPSAHSTDPGWQDRFVGYLKAMALFGGESPRMWVHGGERSAEHLGPALAAFHRAHRPSAYVLASGMLAPACHEVLAGLGLQVPRDLSLVAADHARDSLQGMRLTRVFFEYADLGRAAVRLLATRLACRPMPQVRTVLQGRFTPGETSAAPAPNG